MSTPRNPVHWFEIPVADMPRAIKFYEAVFGYSMESLDMGDSRFSFFPMEDGAEGSSGTLIHNPALMPSQQGSTVYFSVASINPVLEKITQAGGKIFLPRTSVGPYGYIAQFEDSEGNRVALHEAFGA